MAKLTSFTFLVDNITPDNAEMLRKALLSDEKITDVAVKINSGVVVITASKGSAVYSADGLFDSRMQASE